MAERPRPSVLPGDVGFQMAIDAIAKGTSDEIAVWRNNTGATLQVTELAYTPDTAVTGATTDNFILQGKSLTAAGAAAHNITSAKTYGLGVDITQWVKDALTLSTTAANILVADGELVMLSKTETGAGLALPAGLVTVKGRFV